jgi:chromatin structure-remodeling complex protein RSC7
MLEHAREARYVKCLYMVFLTNRLSRFNAAIGAIRRTNLTGMYDPHTNLMQYPKTMQPSHARWEQINDYEVASKLSTNGHTPDSDPGIFTPVDPKISRNYMVVDTIYQSGPSPHCGIPGLDGDAHDLGFNGLSGVSDEIKALLPPDCLVAFEEALSKELEWKGQYTTENRDTHRKAPVIDKGLLQ